MILFLLSVTGFVSLMSGSLMLLNKGKKELAYFFSITALLNTIANLLHNVHFYSVLALWMCGGVIYFLRREQQLNKTKKPLD